FSQGVAGGPPSQLQWLGPTRSEGERKQAKARAQGRALATADAGPGGEPPRRRSRKGHSGGAR
ncbi:MAG TPA: hypothetical protein VGQ91_18125, partial [Ideonella sp.]|nr:hypothetical protein [Ideonella sp.]